MEMPKRAQVALRFLEETLRPLGAVWAVGGSTGLLLQGGVLAAEPRDLDLYADEDDARVIHCALAAFATDEQEWNETEIYRSLLSHYEIEGVSVELVGAFEVRAQASEYAVRTRYMTEAYPATSQLDNGREIRLMPLVHELIFNVLRERPDRYEAVAAVCRRSGRHTHAELLNELARRSRFSPPVRRRLDQLLEL
ncbi:hypothetical protein WMW72_05740 [Paenibacillus filicis]|uniref:Nucleotidyl transferase AbiEii/AbiGii toxin family protein n=2 Tax=Paenibacillus filicis TaxID=669464 RepID=A0ABU9DEV8_9BACL